MKKFDMKWLKANAGFSLIELMTVVGILSILATVAIPAFGEYIHKARSSEAVLNLGKLIDLQTRYYYRPKDDATTSSFLVILAMATDLEVGGGYYHPMRNKADYEANVPSTWDRLAVPPQFNTLGFSPTGQLYYTYSLFPAAAGIPGIPAGTKWHSVNVKARADLDMNGLFSHFYRNIRTEPPTSDIIVTGGLIVENTNR